MLVCKGSSIKFKLKDGRTISARGSLLHDPKGTHWPKCSLLVCSFSRDGGEVTDAQKSDVKSYLGRTYQPHIGSCNVPPSNLSEWQLVGELRTIYYARPGRKAPGRYFHHFGQRRLAAFYKSGKARLYKRGNAYRVELGRGCVADGRGIVFP